MRLAPATLLALVAAAATTLTTALGTERPAVAPPLRVLCTTYPVYQLARNVVLDRGAVSLDLMLPGTLGCPHDYVLTPQDMQKLARADLLMANGLGLEEFLGAPVRRANPGLRVFESASGIGDVLAYASPGSGTVSTGTATHRDHDSGPNPHAFASPRMAARMVLAMATSLGRLDPSGAAFYDRNARTYASRLETLGAEFEALGHRLRNNRVVTEHGVFDYLARDTGLEVVAVIQANAGQEPSASEMLTIVRTIRRTKAGAVFTEPQYPMKIGQTIASEAGVPVATLDPVATGPASAPVGYYELIMHANLDTLARTLGTR